MSKLTAVVVLFLIGSMMSAISITSNLGDVSASAEYEGYGSQDNVIGYSESQIVVLSPDQETAAIKNDNVEQDKIVQCYSLDQIRPISLTAESGSVKEIMDNTIGSLVVKKAVAVGSQVMIEGTIIDGCPMIDYPVLAIFDVRDSEGMTTFFAWQNMTMNENEQATVGISWTPDREGDYSIRLFTYHCPGCLGILHPVLRYELSVVPR